MIGNYANQSLVWNHVLTINDYNEAATYSTATIKGRMETGHKLVRNNKGEEVVSSARVFTESAVECGDLIDEKLVISVESTIKLNGSVGYYTVFLI